MRPPAPSARGVRAHLGVIDVGSNAIRLQVARVFGDGSFRVVHDEREPVHLGEDVFRTGTLSAEAVRRALDTLGRYRETAQRLGVRRVRSVATSAVREAGNRDLFAAEVQRATGLKLEVISGAEEALFIARAVLPSAGPDEERVALVDLGGGSTEMSVVEQGAVRFTVSVPVGSIRLTQLFCRSDPLAPEDEAALRAYVRARLAEAIEPGALAPCATILGSAGTIGAVGNFIRRRPSGPRATAAVSHSGFTVAELQEAAAEIKRMTIAERRLAPGVEEKRSEIIVAGALTLEEVCGFVGASRVQTVRRGLRDGIMLDEVDRLRREPVRGSAPGRRRVPGNGRSPAKP